MIYFISFPELAIKPQAEPAEAITPIMPRTDEAAAFYHAVYLAIQEIPRGRVTTYGHIAALIGTRTSQLSSNRQFRLSSRRGT